MVMTFASQALAAKVKARYGKRLSENQYNDLLHKRSVAEVAGYLKSLPGYSEMLRDIQESTIHRGQLENILRRSYFFQYLELMNYNFDGKDGLYTYLIRRYEVEQILKRIQAINSGATEEYVAQIPTFVSTYARFDFMGLSSAKDFDTLLAKLKKTPYEKALAPYKPLRGELIDYSACEQALYACFYVDLCKNIRSSFQGKQQQELLKIIAYQVELRDIQIIYRLKLFYNMPSNKIRLYLLPEVKESGMIRPKLMDKLITAATPEQFLELFEGSIYGKMLPQDSPNFEYSLSYIRYKLFCKELTFSTSTPVIFLSYLLLGEIQIQNIITIIEGIRYQIEPDEIKKLVIL